MKKRDFFKLFLLPLVAMPLYADMPQPGVYGGVLFGFTWSSPISDPLIIPSLEAGRFPFIERIINLIIGNLQSVRGSDFELNYSAFGQIGGQIGYRFDSIRLEGQFFYNTSPYRKLKIHGLLRDFHIDSNTNLSNYITGETNTAAGMLNIYYDFLKLPIKLANITPFVGVGGGYANVSNNLKIYKDGSALNNDPISPNGSHFAGQLMAGLLYFIDEFSTIGLDYRYFTTASESHTVGAGTTTFRNQIQSANLTYNGSFNFG